jgi:predicted double-glycine peptidase
MVRPAMASILGPDPARRRNRLGNRLLSAFASHRGAIVLAAFAALTAGPAFSAGERPVRSLLEMRQDGVVVQKFDLSCGAAALATILNFQHGDFVTEKEVAQGLIRRKEYLENPEIVRIRQGFSLLDLKRYVEGRGFRGIGFGKLGLKDLATLAPIIVPIKVHGYNHFVVFRGQRGDRVLLADPAYGNRTMSVDQFQAAWLDLPPLGKVGFIVTRGETKTPPNALAPRPEHFLAAPDAVLRQALPF